ncbi:hypothetical protein [Virgibacillus halodenitrificans]|uniref:DUF4309 domain-containing protein n=1 Tax=Virgibacillus halodenitrificans TaxID=1482 RepID=A0ABR7VK99_VIRHA|nr:hypothetical protein [Virgibacillus halodenitrificans]MBD1222146.1 hypothetical protein [Virgibacillus halodenitrificans]
MCNSFGPFVKSIRKQIFISLLVLGVIIYFFIIQQRSTQITFEEALDEILSDQPIKKLMIADDKNEIIEIMNSKLVNDLMKDSAHMLLKQVENISIEPLYNITLYTEEYNIYALQVNETTVRIGRDFYVVRGNNIFFESIKQLTSKEPAIE